MWGKSIGSTSDEFSSSIAIDSVGDIYVSGGFVGTMDFDPDVGVQTLTPAGGGDGFLLKLNSAGDFEWVRQFGGALNDISLQIAVDSDDNVYVGGWVNGEATIAGQGVVAQDDDGFVAKFSPTGVLEWKALFGGPGTDDSYGVTVSALDEVFVTGTVQATVDLDPTTGTFEHVVEGVSDGYVVRLHADGDFLSAGTFGGEGSDQGIALAADSDDNIFVAGATTPPADADPGDGVFTVSGPDSLNGLILKLRGPSSTPSTLTISGTVEAAGNALACATVRAEGLVDGGAVVRVATVNADGGYEMRLLPTSADGSSPTAYTLQAFAPGFISETATVDPADFDGTAAVLDFDLAPHSLNPGEVATGIVVDEQTIGGSTVTVALGGARVEALSGGVPLDPPVFTFTCAEGRFELPLPAGKGDVLLHFSAPQYNAQDVAPAPGGESLNVVLEPKFAFSKSIAGAVTRASNNEGIEGATVTANLPGGTLGLSVETDASGLFQITVPDSGEYFAEASAADFPAKSGVTVVSDAFPVGEINFALGEGGGGGGGCASGATGSNSAGVADALIGLALVGALWFRRYRIDARRLR